MGPLSLGLDIGDKVLLAVLLPGASLCEEGMEDQVEISTKDLATNMYVLSRIGLGKYRDRGA